MAGRSNIGVTDELKQIRKLLFEKPLATEDAIESVELEPIHPQASKEELNEFRVKKNREPYKKLPNRLPTFGMMPHPPDEHKHIGMYENKQDLYLLIAHTFNVLMDRLEKLEQKLDKLYKDV